MFSKAKHIFIRLKRSSTLKFGAILFGVFALISAISITIGIIDMNHEIKSLGSINKKVANEIYEVIFNTFRFTLSVGFILSLIVTLFFSFVAQKRLDRISSTLGLLSDGNLNARTGVTKSRDDLDIVANDLDKTAEKLQALVIQTRQLGANIAHDLRTPLARIGARLDEINCDDDKVYEELERSSNVINSILRISQIEAATNKEHWKTYSLNQLAQGFYDDFAALAEDARREITIELNSYYEALFDRDLIFQALANLYQNALHYGEGTITVFTSGTQIGVRDMGEGVPDAQIQNISKPTVRLDPTRNSEGSGLGLALTKAIAQHHRAQLEFENLETGGFEGRLRF